MIKNDRQYRITKAHAERFQQALDRLDVPADAGTAGIPLRRMQQDALRSQLDDLREELVAYEALRAG